MKNIELTKSKFVPVPELRMTSREDRAGFVLSTPWVRLQVAVHDDQIAQIEKIQALVARGATEFIPELSEFLEFFRAYPLALTLPRDELEPYISKQARVLEFKNPSELVRSILRRPMTRPLPEGFSIPLEELLKFSEVRGGTTTSEKRYDPLSVYSFLTHWRLQQESSDVDRSRFAARLVDLQRTNDGAFLRLAAKILMQTFEVTRRCESSLAPAAALEGPAQTLVQKFMLEELGHDRLVQKSLSALGVEKVQASDILESTRLMMDLLRFSALHHFPSFACMVGAFEGSHYKEEDPMALLLQKSSCPKAAEGIQKHFLINKNGNHGAVGEAFLQSMGSLSKIDVTLAAQMLELVVWGAADLARDLEIQMKAAA